MTSFQEMHLRLVAKIHDVKSTGAAITLASEDGKIRTSAERSKDLMTARYWVWSLYRAASRRLFLASKAITVTAGYANLSEMGIASPKDMVLYESGLLRKSIPVYDGDELPYFEEAARSYGSREVYAGLVSDGDSAANSMRLRVILGVDLPVQNTASYTWVLSFYEGVRLEELTAASTSDVIEPRSWWDAMETYAEYIAWNASANFERAAATRQRAIDLALTMIRSEHGDEGVARVQKYLQAQGG